MTVLWLAAPSFAQEVDFGGKVASDLRFALSEPEEVDPWVPQLATHTGIPWNRTSLGTRTDASAGKWRGVADVELMLLGQTPTAVSLPDLSDASATSPVRIEVDALYVEARDLLWRGHDLRIGQQVVQFGVGDQFNPTNTINPNDVEDPLRFGDQAGNAMIRTDMTRGMTTFTAVLVPVFLPARVPASAPLGLSEVDRLPFNEEELRWRIAAEKAFAEDLGFPTVVSTATAEPPPAELENMAVALRLGTVIGSQDLGVSWYRGHADTPVAAHTHTTQLTGPFCDPEDADRCVDGLLSSDVTLTFPEITVYGVNGAGELPLPGKAPPLGWRIEAAVVVPERVHSTITNDDIALLGVDSPAGEYAYPGGDTPTVLADTPYPKWVVGLDATLGRHVYVNAQWVHGTFDELGAGDNLLQTGFAVRNSSVAKDAALGVCALTSDGSKCIDETLRVRQSDLAVVGVDVRFRSQRGLLRLFTITDLTGLRSSTVNPATDQRTETRLGAFSDEALSFVLYPELSYDLGDGLSLAGGALVQLGAPETKFGDPAAGGSFAFMRAAYAF